MMRIAYLAAHLPRRRELAPGPIDAEWIVHAQGTTEVVVFADYAGEGTDLVGAAGVETHISPKRPVPISDGGSRTAEEAQAGILLELHLAKPFDAIVYDTAHTTDWAWHEPRLGAVPRGLALGAGPMRDVRIVTASPGLFRSHGRTLWALTGALASADFLLGDVSAGAYGVDDSALPPRYSLADLPGTPPPAGPVDLMAVVALSEDPAGLASVVTRALERAPAGRHTVVAVIHPDIATGVETTRDILMAALPHNLANRVRVAEPSSDGIAAGLLSQAGVVVAARRSDLAVPAVADAAADVGSIVLDDSGEPPAPRLAGASLTKRPHLHPQLVPADRPFDELIEMIDPLAATAPAVVLYSREAAVAAERIWEVPGSSLGGLLLVCDTGPYLGEADPTRPAFNLLGFGIESWPSVRRLMLRTRTLHELVEAASDLTHAHRTNLTTLPIAGASHGRLAGGGRLLPAWVTDTGSLPAPEPFGQTQPVAVTTAYQHPPGEASIKHWAETHGFRDRVRLSLPWKWGLLNRAMRDRW